MRGIGVAVITSTSGSSPLPRSSARCSTPKRCCSSITATPRSAELGVAVEQRVRADEDVDLAAVAAPAAMPPALGRGRAVREQLDPHRPLAEQRALGAATVEPVEQLHAIARWCCSASTSVGAMNAPW